jgi:Domain of unknown function (DUF4124)
MRKWLILLSALSGTAASAAPAWRWVDADGTVHYSDRPVPGAQQVDLAGAQGFGAQNSARALQAPSAAGEPATAGQPYQVEIVSPAEQETLWNIGTALPVQVRFQPALQPGHRYDLLFDGQRRNVNTANPRTTVPDVYRGTHTVQVVVIDSAGTEVTRSPARTFFVQQTSVLNPNRANPNRAPGAN